MSEQQAFNLTGDKVTDDLNAELMKDFGFFPDLSGHYLSSGCLVVDLIIAGLRGENKDKTGGWPLGQFITLWGPDSAGKTTLANSIIKQAQAVGGIGYLLPTEPKVCYNFEFARQMGIDTNRVFPVEVRNTEDVFSVIDRIVDKRKDMAEPTVIVWDSIGATKSRTSDNPASFKEGGKNIKHGIDIGNYYSRKVASEAQLNTGFLGRDTLKKMSKSNIILIGINQNRDRFGSMYGEKVMQPGGWSILHAPIMILKMWSNLSAKVGNTSVEFDSSVMGPKGIYINIETVKNQMAPPHRTCAIPLWFSYGIDDCLCSLLFLQQYKGLEYIGGYYNFRGKKWRKRELRDSMYDDPIIRAEVESEVIRIFREATE